MILPKPLRYNFQSSYGRYYCITTSWSLAPTTHCTSSYSSPSSRCIESVVSYYLSILFGAGFACFILYWFKWRCGTEGGITVIVVGNKHSRRNMILNHLPVQCVNWKYTVEDDTKRRMEVELQWWNSVDDYTLLQRKEGERDRESELWGKKQSKKKKVTVDRTTNDICLQC